MKYSFVFVNSDPGRVSEAVMRDVVEANLLQQHDDLAPCYGLESALVSELPAANPVPLSTDALTVVPCYFRPSGADDPPGAVAFHYVNPKTNRPECHVLTDVVEQLGGPGDFTDKLSTSASHECCEAREDLYADAWADLPDGRKEAREICDRVQNSTYSKKVASGRVVRVSNFLLEGAFALGPLPGTTRVDFVGVIPPSNPRMILPDQGDGAGAGYAAIQGTDGVTVDVDGDKVSALRYSHKTMAALGVDVAKLVDEWRDELTPVVDAPVLPTFDDSDVPKYDPRREARAERASEAAGLLLKWIPVEVFGDADHAVLERIRAHADGVVAEENAKLKGQAND